MISVWSVRLTRREWDELILHCKNINTALYSYLQVRYMDQIVFFRLFSCRRGHGGCILQRQRRGGNINSAEGKSGTNVRMTFEVTEVIMEYWGEEGNRLIKMRRFVTRTLSGLCILYGTSLGRARSLSGSLNSRFISFWRKSKEMNLMLT